MDSYVDDEVATLLSMSHPAAAAHARKHRSGAHIETSPSKQSNHTQSRRTRSNVSSGTASRVSNTDAGSRLESAVDSGAFIPSGKSQRTTLESTRREQKRAKKRLQEAKNRAQEARRKALELPPKNDSITSNDARAHSPMQTPLSAMPTPQPRELAYQNRSCSSSTKPPKSYNSTHERGTSEQSTVSATNQHTKHESEEMEARPILPELARGRRHPMVHGESSTYIHDGMREEAKEEAAKDLVRKLKRDATRRKKKQERIAFAESEAIRVEMEELDKLRAEKLKAIEDEKAAQKELRHQKALQRQKEVRARLAKLEKANKKSTRNISKGSESQTNLGMNAITPSDQGLVISGLSPGKTKDQLNSLSSRKQRLAQMRSAFEPINVQAANNGGSMAAAVAPMTARESVKAMRSKRAVARGGSANARMNNSSPIRNKNGSTMNTGLPNLSQNNSAAYQEMQQTLQQTRHNYLGSQDVNKLHSAQTKQSTSYAPQAAHNPQMKQTVSNTPQVSSNSMMKQTASHAPYISHNPQANYPQMKQTVSNTSQPNLQANHPQTNHTRNLSGINKQTAATWNMDTAVVQQLNQVLPAEYQHVLQQASEGDPESMRQIANYCVQTACLGDHTLTVAQNLLNQAANAHGFDSHTQTNHIEKSFNSGIDSNQQCQLAGNTKKSYSESIGQISNYQPVNASLVETDSVSSGMQHHTANTNQHTHSTTSTLDSREKPLLGKASLPARHQRAYWRSQSKSDVDIHVEQHFKTVHPWRQAQNKRRPPPSTVQTNNIRDDVPIGEWDAEEGEDRFIDAVLQASSNKQTKPQTNTFNQMNETNVTQSDLYKNVGSPVDSSTHVHPMEHALQIDSTDKSHNESMTDQPNVVVQSPHIHRKLAHSPIISPAKQPSEKQSLSTETTSPINQNFTSKYSSPDQQKKKSNQTPTMETTQIVREMLDHRSLQDMYGWETEDSADPFINQRLDVSVPGLQHDRNDTDVSLHEIPRDRNDTLELNSQKSQQDKSTRQHKVSSPASPVSLDISSNVKYSNIDTSVHNESDQIPHLPPLSPLNTSREQSSMSPDKTKQTIIDVEGESEKHVNDTPQDSQRMSTKDSQPTSRDEKDSHPTSSDKKDSQPTSRDKKDSQPTSRDMETQQDIRPNESTNDDMPNDISDKNRVLSNDIDTSNISTNTTSHSSLASPNKAATKIQSLFRGNHARQLIQKHNNAMEEELEREKAKRIQRNVEFLQVLAGKRRELSREVIQPTIHAFSGSGHTLSGSASIKTTETMSEESDTAVGNEQQNPSTQSNVDVRAARAAFFEARMKKKTSRQNVSDKKQTSESDEHNIMSLSVRRAAEREARAAFLSKMYNKKLSHDRDQSHSEMSKHAQQGMASADLENKSTLESKTDAVSSNLTTLDMDNTNAENNTTDAAPNNNMSTTTSSSMQTNQMTIDEQMTMGNQTTIDEQTSMEKNETNDIENNLFLHSSTIPSVPTSDVLTYAVLTSESNANHITVDDVDSTESHQKDDTAAVARAARAAYFERKFGSATSTESVSPQETIQNNKTYNKQDVTVDHNKQNLPREEHELQSQFSKDSTKRVVTPQEGTVSDEQSDQTVTNVNQNDDTLENDMKQSEQLSTNVNQNDGTLENDTTQPEQLSTNVNQNDVTLENDMKDASNDVEQESVSSQAQSTQAAMTDHVPLVSTFSHTSETNYTQHDVDFVERDTVGVTKGRSISNASDAAHEPSMNDDIEATDERSMDNCIDDAVETTVDNSIDGDIETVQTSIDKNLDYNVDRSIAPNTDDDVENSIDKNLEDYSVGRSIDNNAEELVEKSIDNNVHDDIGSSMDKNIDVDIAIDQKSIDNNVHDDIETSMNDNIDGDIELVQGSVHKDLEDAMDRSVDKSIDDAVDRSSDRNIDDAADRSVDKSIDDAIDRSSDRNIDEQNDSSPFYKSVGGEHERDKQKTAAYHATSHSVQDTSSTDIGIWTQSTTETVNSHEPLEGLNVLEDSLSGMDSTVQIPLEEDSLAISSTLGKTGVLEGHTSSATSNVDQFEDSLE